MIDLDLYRTAPAYRDLADRLPRAQDEVGALRAASGTAVSDLRRAKAEFSAAIDAIAGHVQRCRALLRDDPGTGGSGGT
jgi:hypothetical protein